MGLVAVRDRPIPTIYFIEKHEFMGRMIGYLQDETDPERIKAVLTTIHQLANAIRTESLKWRSELRDTTLPTQEVP